jgi:hypothetical protein
MRLTVKYYFIVGITKMKTIIVKLVYKKQIDALFNFVWVFLRMYNTRT